ncbi:hypothetical protein ARUE_c11110 [Arthrobacter sp. Rue61a]|nr:hypothetical protein ARUE_c11110 [Arthrobacter sp. Rue61a]
MNLGVIKRCSYLTIRIGVQPANISIESFEAGKALEQRGLPVAVVATDNKNPRGRDAECDIIDDLPATVALGEIRDVQH